MSEARRLSLELERAAVRAIFATYTDLNHTFFRGKLRRPTLELSDGAVRLGEWIRGTRRIRLSRKLLSEHGWGALVEVLKHEMAHQYADEVLGAVDESAHGPTFRKVCEERGFDARAVGTPDAGAHPKNSPILERIAKLLALAESSNEHEAQAAMSAAQRLMLKHNLADVTRAGGESLSFRHLGRPTGRVTEAERILANILAEHFFVDTIWVPVWRAEEGKRGSVLEVCGRDENLEMADYVYAFLTRAAERLWKEHKKSRKIRGNRDRRAYVAGVMSGFEKKLAEESRKNAAEGLVWVGDPGVEHYFKRRHPRVRWTRHVSSRNSEAHQRGVEAGKKIVLHKGVGSGPGGAGPKLLGR
ncbi:MAG TPA: DUF2786 domain-containing protein [Polyangiaceae bacterium]|nr:DUF2786 domain-containing protein [Polyangiaceae bacterium]